MKIKIIDDDNGTISAEMEASSGAPVGRAVRSWMYRDDAEQRQKMVMAREFAEGWYQADNAHRAISEHHHHVAGTAIGRDTDTCALCLRDIRDPIHIRAS